MPSLYILIIDILICVLLILVDQTNSGRNHRLGFLRISVANSRSRIEALDRSICLPRQFKTAESYYEHLLGKITEELATSREGQEVVCTAALLYYEDWSITSMQKNSR
jgi:hypothetical protein